MCSSDSDDDSYGNIAQKLQLLKNKYKENKDSTNPLGESPNVSESVFSAEIETDSCVSLLENANTSLNDSGEFTLDSIIANNTKKPVIRSRRKKDQTSEEPLERSRRRKQNETVPDRNLNAEPPAKRSTSRKLREVSGNSNDIAGSSNDIAGSSNDIAGSSNDIAGSSNEIDANLRGRGRRRGRRGRGRQSTRNISNRSTNGDTGLLFPFGIDLSDFIQPSNRPLSNNRQPPNIDQSIPTYSVGNTEEYTDMSDNQGLFTTKNDDVEIIDDNDSFDENEELSVKVYWQSSEIFKFTIRKYQKFTQIFDYFAKKEHVTHDKLFFTYKDNILSKDDTPDSISYSIAKFIDGGIVNQSVTQMVSKSDENNIKNGLKLKFQCQNMKKPYETVITLEDRLLSAMMKCAEHFEKPFDKLKFYFDGDLISGKSTAKDLELEGGECIDVKIIS